MISEAAVIGFLEVEILAPEGGFVLGRSVLGEDDLGDGADELVWAGYLGPATQCKFQRGGKRAGVTNAMEVGLLTITLLNAGDPALNPEIVPGSPLRVRYLGEPNEEGADPILYTGQLADVDMVDTFDRQRNLVYQYVTLTAVDAVQQHANTTRYGAIASAGYERWEARIGRLALSSTAPINPPPLDEPIVRYAL